MKRRKFVVTLILILAMLVQCITPLCTGVNAATDISISLSENLYYAVKDDLIAQNKVGFSYDDTNCILTMTDTNLAKITSLNLSEKDISDLTGISAFIYLKELDLSSNSLTVDSNLEELNSLNLTSLDLSSNQLSSVSALTNKDSIENLDISNQEVMLSEVIGSTNSGTVTYTLTLPDLLMEDGAMNPDWFTYTYTGSAYVNWGSVNGNQLQITISVNDVALSGLITLIIDVNTPESKIFQTHMELNYCVVPEGQTGIIFKDDAFYKTVKEQLTQGQDINDELDSYGSKGTTLYVDAYDDAMILVIDDNVILNKIPTLIIDHNVIRDLTGLEAFIGLDTTLDASYNYITSIEKIIELAENKIIAEEKLQAKYNEELSVMSSDRSILVENQNRLEEIKESLTKLRAELQDLLAADTQDADAIENKRNEIWELEDEEDVCEAQIEKYTEYIKLDIKDLYEIYNNVYLLTSILTADTVDLSLSDIGDYSEVYAREIMGNISTLEQTGSLTEWEANIIIDTFDIPTQKTVTRTDENGDTYDSVEDIENPITNYFNDFAIYNGDYYGFLYDIKIIDAIIVAGNYCIFQKAYNGETSCTFEEAFDELANRLDSFGLQSDFAVLAKSEYSNYVSGCLCSTTTVNDSFEEISGKLVNNSTLVSTLVRVPRLRHLDLTDNNISSIDGIEILEELQTLRLFKNFLGMGDISNVNWQSFTRLYLLDLGYNQLTFSQIKCLEGMPALEELYLTNNLLSGNFDFSITSFSKLNYADFSYNQISNIESFINAFGFKAKAYNMTAEEYIISGYAPTVLFQDQTLEINVTVKQSSDGWITVDLPKIFSQARSIDPTRTSFGIQSLSGTVDATGATATVKTSDLGDYTFFVNISDGTNNVYSNNSPYGDPNFGGVAYGTICTIHLTVTDEDYSGVFEPDGSNDDDGILKVVTELGGQCQLEFTFTGQDLENRNLTFVWTITDKTSNNTILEVEGTPSLADVEKLIQDAILYIGEDETVDEITVEVLVYEDGVLLPSGDNNKITVVIQHTSVNDDNDGNSGAYEKVVWQAVDDLGNSLSVGAGEDQKLVFTYESGSVVEGMIANWTVSGNTSENTTITDYGEVITPGVSLVENALLSIGEDEEADKITVTVTLSNGDTRNIVFTKTTIEVTPDDSDDDTNTDTDVDVDVDVDVDDSESDDDDPNGSGSSSSDSGNTGSGSEGSSTGGFDGGSDSGSSSGTGSSSDITYGYETDGDIIYVKTPGITVSNFESRAVTTAGYTAVVTNSSDSYDSSILATSAVLTIYDTNGNEVDHYDVVVLGDVNGDGRVDALDSGLIRNVINGVAKIDGSVYEAAADVNMNGSIDKEDSVLVLQYRAQTILNFIL